MAKQPKNTICLWYDRDAEEAARFYAETFPDSSVGAVHRAAGDFPSGKEGDVLMVEFVVMGIPCLGLNGGPHVKHNEAFSFQVATAGPGRNRSLLECDHQPWWGRKRLWLVPRQMGHLMADYSGGADQGGHQPRSRSRQACLRCPDADEEDRHRGHRSSASRLSE